MPKPRKIPKINEKGEILGIRCTRCGCGHLPLIYLKPIKGGQIRVRQCRHCGRRQSTKETSVSK